MKPSPSFITLTIILEELFEPTIIFFGLMNFLAMFQIIINKILQNFINTRKVVSFISNVIVKTEKKEKHKKVAIRLIENNLYIKLKKYKCKVRKVEFLEVVIRLEGIKMKKKKMKDVKLKTIDLVFSFLFYFFFYFFSYFELRVSMILYISHIFHSHMITWF